MSAGTLKSFDSNRQGHFLQQFVERNRIIEDPHARRVINRIRHRRTNAAQAQLADAFAFIGEARGSVSPMKITSWCGMSACTGTS